MAPSLSEAQPLARSPTILLFAKTLDSNSKDLKGSAPVIVQVEDNQSGNNDDGTDQPFLTITNLDNILTMPSDDKSTILYDEKSSNSYDPKKDLAPEIYPVASSSSSSTTASLPSQWTISKTKKSFLKSTLYITSSSGTPHHAVSTHSTHPGATIHTTNDQSSAPLITARKHSNSIHIQMPSQNLDFKAGTHWRLTTHPTVEWNMALPNGSVEHFEWAHSCGGWNLTRRGGEVLAKWRFSYCSSRLSGDFEFVGAGASGELGEVFPYVAAVIALAIGKMDRDTNMAVLAGTNS